MQKPVGNLTSLTLAREVLHHLARLGVEKINFAGGEPLCNPLIFDVTRLAKDLGFVVGIVSNGSFLNQKSLNRLSGSVDWIGLSIDSSNEEIEKILGRGYGSHI